MTEFSPYPGGSINLPFSYDFGVKSPTRIPVSYFATLQPELRLKTSHNLSKASSARVRSERRNALGPLSKAGHKQLIIKVLTDLLNGLIELPDKLVEGLMALLYEDKYYTTFSRQSARQDGLMAISTLRYTCCYQVRELVSISVFLNCKSLLTLS